jgi:hypothetical protein
VFVQTIGPLYPLMDDELANYLGVGMPLATIGVLVGTWLSHHTKIMLSSAYKWMARHW